MNFQISEGKVPHATKTCLYGKFSIDDILDKCEVGHAHGKAEIYVSTFAGRDGNEHQSNKVKRYIKVEEKKEMKPW